MPPTATATTPKPVVEDPWDLDMRVVEAEHPHPQDVVLHRRRLRLQLLDERLHHQRCRPVLTA
ncbi:hypothetical protein GCM10020220_059770 [Nonomuraea rubra]|uniref:hypothetical protein n=1 Tax=Nonomuraea rubra TaxID=46180 RepID=UPI0031EB5F04